MFDMYFFKSGINLAHLFGGFMIIIGIGVISLS
jgi:hypothetical protein